MAKRIIYDEEDDILFVSKGKKVESSIDIGDFIIDIDTEGFISGIEILDASRNLNIPESKLARIEKASLRVTYRPHDVHIFLTLEIEGKENDISIPLAVELGHRRTDQFQLAVM